MAPNAGDLWALVQQASRQPWASALEVEVADGQLRLRPTSKWGGGRAGATILIPSDGLGFLDLVLQVGQQQRGGQGGLSAIKVRPNEGMEQLEALLVRLFELDPLAPQARPLDVLPGRGG